MQRKSWEKLQTYHLTVLTEEMLTKPALEAQGQGGAVHACSAHDTPPHPTILALLWLQTEAD